VDGNAVSTNRLSRVDVAGHLVSGRRPELEHECEVALRDLAAENSFRLVGADQDGGVPGPYALSIGVEENRLVLDVRDAGGQPLRKFILALKPFQRLIKDYFTVCDSYYSAITQAGPAQIEAIDMGRRGLHNEGSALLRDRLADKIEMDHETARRLFTVICVLHIRH
jgi:uncharacterized protein (UPF0262 family)